MEKKPLIGITPQYSIKKKFPFIRNAYLDAVSAAGGLPVLLPIKPGEGDLKQLV